jgi:hypothetical protein
MSGLANEFAVGGGKVAVPRAGDTVLEFAAAESTRRDPPGRPGVLDRE